MKTEFENSNVELARRFAIELLAEKPYSRETLSACYYSLPTTGEKKKVSELWIERLWSRIEGIPSALWRNATGSHRAFVTFVHGFWDKDV